MKRTTIFVPEHLERDLQLYARRERRPVAAVVREAVEQYLARAFDGVRVPSFAGVGSSGRRHVAERHEALLFKQLDPHGGGAPAREPSYGRAPRTRSPRRKR